MVSPLRAKLRACFRPVRSAPAPPAVSGEDPPPPRLGQAVVLEVGLLVGGGDAGVADEHGSLRSPIVPKPALRVKRRDDDFGTRTGTDIRPHTDRCRGPTRPSRFGPFSGSRASQPQM